MSNAVQTIEDHPPTERTSTAITPMEMLSRAVESGANIEMMEKLLALQERWQANEARKAFDAAMADAKAEFEPIIKNRRVAFDGKNGKAATDYRHEDLAQIERQIGPVLTKHGLSYRFRVESEVEQPVRVTCIVAHRDGHSEETTLAAGRDTSGNKNSIQAIGSAITYLQRYTLKAALGLAVAHDDDGQRSDEKIVETITEEQVMTIRELLEATNASERKFLAIGQIERLEDMRAEDFESAVRMLKERERRQ